jgi:hypothetical protein
LWLGDGMIELEKSELTKNALLNMNLDDEFLIKGYLTSLIITRVLDGWIYCRCFYKHHSHIIGTETQVTSTFVPQRSYGRMDV